MESAQKAFCSQLVSKGLLNERTGSKIVEGIDGEDALVLKWQQAASRFIHKGRKVSIGMRAERLLCNESRCYPVFD